MDFDYSQRQCLISPPDVRAYKGVAKTIDLPEEFELWHPSIKDQGGCGSCIAHSLASCVEFYHHAETGKYAKMSTGFIYGNRRNTLYKGEGMYLSKALSNLRHYGTTKARDWDNNKEVPEAITLFEEAYDTYKDKAYQNRITGYYRLYDINSIKASIYQGNPCPFTIKFRADMRFKDGQFIINEKSEWTGSHCMYIYGWNKDGWKICNSWSSYWGTNGTTILPFSTKLSEVYGVQDTFNSEKVNAEIEELQKQLESLHEDYVYVYAHSGPELTEVEQKKIKEIEDKMDEIEDKIKKLQQGYVDVHIPFENCQWLGKILNAIVQFFWKIFHKE